MSMVSKKMLLLGCVVISAALVFLISVKYESSRSIRATLDTASGANGRIRRADGGDNKNGGIGGHSDDDRKIVRSGNVGKSEVLPPLVGSGGGYDPVSGGDSRLE